MKKIYLTGLLLLLTSLTITSAPVTPNRAKAIAAQYLIRAAEGHKVAPAAKTLSLAYTGKDAKGQNTLYAFNNGRNEGFVIIAGDDRAPEILGYTDRGTYDTAIMPTNMKWWISQMEAQMEYLISHPNTTMSKPRRAAKVVEPLLGEIAWDQESPYNLYCPYITYYDEYEEEEVSGRAPTGCVATALAQVMYFWKYPNASTGSISYTTATAKQTVSADLNTSYDWSVMTPTCDKYSEDTTKSAIAKLMFNIGAALQSDYTPSGTGAYDVDVVPVITKYFGYDKGARYVPRDYTPASDYESMLISEIEAGRPVPYGGVTRRQEGHFFVLDGMDADGLYHVNWGWGGMNNGYFLISSLQPMQQGVGGSASNDAFKYHQLFIAGMQPDQGGSAETVWNLVYNKVKIISDTFDRDSAVSTSIYGLTNISSTSDTLFCKLNWTLMTPDSTIIWQSTIKPDTLGLYDGYDKLTYKLSIPDSIKAGSYLLVPTYTTANDDYSKTRFMNVLAGANKYYSLTLTDTDMTWETEGGPKVSVEDITPDTLIGGQTNKITVTFNNQGGDYVGDVGLLFYVNGKRRVYPTQTTESRIVAIPGHTVTTLTFTEPLNDDLVTDDDYVVKFIGTSAEEDEYGIKEDIELAIGHIALKGAVKPAMLNIDDDLRIISGENGVVPSNNIVLEATISNEGNDFNGPLTAVFCEEDEWEETERIATDSIAIPAGSTGTTFTFTLAMEKAIEGHTYELSLYNPQSSEYIIPSDNNRVKFIAGKPVNTGISKTTVDKVISFDGSRILCQAQQISLYNMVGQCVASSNGTSLSTTGLPQGTYILRAKTAQGPLTKKITIRK